MAKKSCYKWKSRVKRFHEYHSMSKVLTNARLARARTQHIRMVEICQAEINRGIPAVKRHRFSKPGSRERFGRAIQCNSRPRCTCGLTRYCDYCLGAWRSGILYGLAKRPKNTRIAARIDNYRFQGPLTREQIEHICKKNLFPKFFKERLQLDKELLALGSAHRITTRFLPHNVFEVRMTSLFVYPKELEESFLKKWLDYTVFREQYNLWEPINMEEDYKYADGTPYRADHYRTSGKYTFNRHRSMDWQLWRFRRLYRLEKLFKSEIQNLIHASERLPLYDIDQATWIPRMNTRNGCLSEKAAKSGGSICKGRKRASKSKTPPKEES